MDYSPLGSSVQGILQARILQWVVLSPGDLLVPGIELRSSALQADSLLSEPPRKPTQKIRDRMWTQILCDSESCDHTYCLDAQSYLRLLCSYKEVLLRSMWTNLATQGQPYPWAKYSFTPADWSGPNHSHLPSWQCFPSIFRLATFSISSSRASTFLSVYKVSLL